MYGYACAVERKGMGLGEASDGEESLAKRG